MQTSGVFFFNLDLGIQSVIGLDGRTLAANGHFEMDPVDPWVGTYSRRAIGQALTESGMRSTFDVVIRTPGSTLDVRMKSADFQSGRNAPVSLAERLIRAGRDDVLDAVIARYEAFIALEAAA